MTDAQKAKSIELSSKIPDEHIDQMLKTVLRSIDLHISLITGLTDIALNNDHAIVRAHIARWLIDLHLCD